MKRFLLLFITAMAVLAPHGLLADSTSTNPPSASFTSVTGKVTIKDKKGKTRPAKQDSQAFEGETVRVPPKGAATLKLFDGSSLNISSDTQFVIKTLQQPAKDEKKIRFSLTFGTLLAQVEKLLTPHSAFEIEGGGVVCGVRGTKFQVSYDPDSDEFDLQVFEGSVVTNSNGQNNLFKSGDQMQFLNGLIQSPGGSQIPMPLNQGQNPNEQSLDNVESTAAAGDLSGQFDTWNGINGDDIFSDPSVGQTAHITIHVNVPGQETHP